MDPREYLLRYFTDLDKIDIPINVKDNSFGGRLARFGSRIGTPVKNFINRKASIPNLLTPRSSTIPSPWGGSITSSPVVNTLGGEVVDVVSSKPQSLLSKVRGLPQRLAGNSQVQKLLGGVDNPVTRRFAGKVGPLKNVPYLNPVIATGMGIHRLSEGKAPLDAFGRPIFQTGGMLLGAGTGFLADSPFSPVADIALGAAGWEAGGRTYDALFDRDNQSKEKDYSEGYGTKLVRMEDGSVRRLPIETEIQGSDLISQDGVITDEVLTGDGDSVSDKVSEFLDKKDYITSRRFRNSPAKRSGLFTDDELWAQKKMNDDFQVYRDAGDLEGFARKYPMSQTAKRLRKNAPYGRPVDF